MCVLGDVDSTADGNNTQHTLQWQCVLGDVDSTADGSSVCCRVCWGLQFRGHMIAVYAVVCVVVMRQCVLQCVLQRVLGVVHMIAGNALMMQYDPEETGGTTKLCV